jgi:hypothetical protein
VPGELLAKALGGPAPERVVAPGCHGLQRFPIERFGTGLRELAEVCERFLRVNGLDVAIEKRQQEVGPGRLRFLQDFFQRVDGALGVSTIAGKRE